MSTVAEKIVSHPANTSADMDADPVMQTLRDAFDKQRADYLRVPNPAIAERRKDLKKLKAMINDHREEIVEALSKDYGNRARQETLFAEVISVTDAINHAIKHVGKWAKVQKRHTDWTTYPGAKNRVIPQPLGVIGVIVPWNFPGNLNFVPLISAFSAGNRAMVKMSDNSRHLCQLLIRVSGDYFPPEKLMFFEGAGGMGSRFAKLPFDLLFFTGSGATGKRVMEAAAKNLTPVVLELGGKSPAVIDPDFPTDKAVDRILFVKQFNAGQICVNTDYVFVHESRLQAFVESAKRWTAKHVPDIQSQDYTSIIDDSAFARLLTTLDDARSKGAEIINLNGDQQPDPATRKMPLQLVLNTTEDMTIRREEIFGPLLPVLTYNDPQEVIDYINSQDRPLAFYPFSNNRKLIQRYLDHVMSGGVTVNDALYHVAQHEIPFGGVGASGMGHYHGREGFNTFSKMRPVFYQARWSFMSLLKPPYGPFANAVYRFMTWLKG